MIPLLKRSGSIAKRMLRDTTMIWPLFARHFKVESKLLGASLLIGSRVTFFKHQAPRITMTTLYVVNHSITGTTARLAESVLDGLNAVAGCMGKLLTIEGAHIVDGRYRNEAVLQALDTCDAMIFGCPTFMGGPSAQFKAFADASSDRWESQRWEGKLCAGFTVGSNPSGDQLATLQYFTVFGAQHGMLWVGLNIPGGYDSEGRNRLGAQLGLISQSTGTLVPDIDLVTARYFGTRVARKALALAGQRDA